MTSCATLTVMTYNIHSGVGVDGIVDLERLATVIEEAAPDLVALQEVDRHRREQSGYADQPGWLAQRLGMSLAFGANLDDDPERPGGPRRQYGTALLSHLPLREWTNGPLPCFAGSEQRGLLNAAVELDGTRLRVLGTHLQHDDEDERVAQVEAIRGVLDDAPTLLLGDLNAIPEGPAYASLAEDFEDAWDQGRPGAGHDLHGRTTSPPHRLRADARRHQRTQCSRHRVTGIRPCRARRGGGPTDLSRPRRGP
jgi:endonuclease/exonuclease/phosphatase family metal-dependent hydrolase